MYVCVGVIDTFGITYMMHADTSRRTRTIPREGMGDWAKQTMLGFVPEPNSNDASLTNLVLFGCSLSEAIIWVHPDIAARMSA